MGNLCASPPSAVVAPHEREMNRVIEETIKRQQQEEKGVLKLLLLGTGESGKSTILKQVVHLYGDKSLDRPERRAPYASIVHNNVLASMKTLCQKSDELAASAPDLHTQMSDAVLGSRNFILKEELKTDQEITPEIGKHISILWSDPGIQNTYKARAQFHLTDSCRYFFNKMEEVARPEYLPSYEDVLQCRARTTGIVETEFTIDDDRFKLVDVGGQRNERKKWIHCFDGVTAVIFVAAINEFDQRLYEDGHTNRVVEALELFQEICNSRWFRDTAMILFLNKKDLLQEKIAEGADLSSLFPDYTGGANTKAALEFLRFKFLDRNDYPDRKTIYTHATCATDTKNVDFTFLAVKDVIIKLRLKECGLIE